MEKRNGWHARENDVIFKKSLNDVKPLIIPMESINDEWIVIESLLKCSEVRKETETNNETNQSLLPIIDCLKKWENNFI